MKDNIKEISSDTGGLTAKNTNGKTGANWMEIIGNAFFVLAWMWLLLIMAYLTMKLFFS